MHESGLIQNLISQVEAIARSQQAETVCKVTLRLGALTPFTPEHFASHFHEFKVGTMAHEAELSILQDTDITSADAGHIRIESIDVLDPSKERSLG